MLATHPKYLNRCNEYILDIKASDIVYFNQNLNYKYLKMKNLVKRFINGKGFLEYRDRLIIVLRYGHHPKS